MASWNLGPKNGFWKGGRVIASNGYVLIRVGRNHRLADVRGYAYEHRMVAEQKLGRPLRTGELVHHRDGDKQNNAPENLEVMASRHHHSREHSRKITRAPGQANPAIGCACGCGCLLPVFDAHGRPRRFVSGHNWRKRNGTDAHRVD